MNIQLLIEAARKFAEKELSEEEKARYKDLFDRKEKQFRDDKEKTKVTKEWLERQYDI